MIIAPLKDWSTLKLSNSIIYIWDPQDLRQRKDVPNKLGINLVTYMQAIFAKML